MSKPTMEFTWNATRFNEHELPRTKVLDIYKEVLKKAFVYYFVNLWLYSCKDKKPDGGVSISCPGILEKSMENYSVGITSSKQSHRGCFIKNFMKFLEKIFGKSVVSKWLCICIY